MQWKEPFKVLEQVKSNNYRIQLANRKKILRTNLLKRYIPAVTKENETLSKLDGQTIAAAILEPEAEFHNQGPEHETYDHQSSPEHETYDHQSRTPKCFVYWSSPGVCSFTWG